jgi:hypothetical protein
MYHPHLNSREPDLAFYVPVAQCEIAERKTQNSRAVALPRFSPSSNINWSYLESLYAVNNAVGAAGVPAVRAEKSAFGVTGVVMNDTARATAMALPGASLALDILGRRRRLCGWAANSSLSLDRLGFGRVCEFAHCSYCRHYCTSICGF